MATRGTVCKFVTKRLSSLTPQCVCDMLLSHVCWALQQVARVFSIKKLRQLLQGTAAGAPDESPPTVAESVAPPGYSCVTLSKNLSLLSPSDPSPQPGQRRLMLFFAWLTAKPRHIRKYAMLMTDLGMDVLIIRLFPLEVVYPTKGSHMVAQQVADFLKVHHSNYDKIGVYGLSVGAYLMCETSKKIYSDKTLCEEAIPKFVCQLYDSPVHLKMAPLGVASSLTDNLFLQRCIVYCIQRFMEMSHYYMARHLEAAAKVMDGAPIQCATFYTYSTIDPLSSPAINEAVAVLWKAKGLKLSRLVYEDTRHCLNYVTHPAEYRRSVYEFFVSVGLAERAAVDEVLLREGLL